VKPITKILPSNIVRYVVRYFNVYVKKKSYFDVYVQKKILTSILSKALYVILTCKSKTKFDIGYVVRYFDVYVLKQNTCDIVRYVLRYFDVSSEKKKKMTQEVSVTVSIENGAPRKVAKTNLSVQIKIAPNFPFELVPQDTGKSRYSRRVI